MRDGYRYDDLELTTLACILLFPQVLKDTALKPKYFKKYSSIFVYFKNFYERFETLDVSLMCSFASNRYKLLKTIDRLMEFDPLGCNFKKYETRLIEMAESSKKEDWLRQKVYEEATSLYFKKITFERFKKRLEDIEEASEKFKWEDE